MTTIRQLAEDEDGIVVTVRTWLSGDFDPRALHRRDGWALWRYRGDHRPRPGRWTVAELIHDVALHRLDDRRAHRRSLRRPQEPMIFLGTRRLVNIKFFGVVPDDTLEGAVATLTIADNAPVLSIPALVGDPGPGEVPVLSDDAPTGPILVDIPGHGPAMVPGPAGAAVIPAGTPVEVGDDGRVRPATGGTVIGSAL